MNEEQVSEQVVNKQQAEQQSAFDKTTDKIGDKAASQTDKALPNLISFGDEGAACQFVDGKIICD